MLTVEENVFLAKRNIVDQIWKEANIVGIRETFPETKEVFEGRTVSRISVDDTVKINNLKHAWQFLFDTLDVPIDVFYIKQMNTEIGQGVVYKAGDLRIGTVTIGGTSWKPEIPTHEKFKADIETILSSYEGVECALKMFAFICRTQPFNDGNKRTAQLVANKILIESGCGIFAIAPEDKLEFETLLVDYYESADDQKLLQFLKKSISQ